MYCDERTIIADMSKKLYRKERKIYWLNKRVEAQQQEILNLKSQIETLKMDKGALEESYINAEMNLAHLTADKDEQAGRIMEMEDGLKRLRISFQWLYETIGSFFAYKEWAKEKIDAIDALLGGSEPYRAGRDDTCNTTKLPCAGCNPVCEHRAKS